MTDPRRVLHPGRNGASDAGQLASRPRAVVVGAGIAGLAAATGLAERGVTVEVIEREGYLGGRVGGWTEKLPDGTDVAMNRGFHAFFRQYYNLRNLLRRTDPALRRLTPVDDYPLVDAQGRRDTFHGLPRTPPWNAVAFALRSPTFRLRDLVQLNARAAAPLAAVSVPDIYHRLDHLDAEAFLEQINFPAAARHLAFEVFSRSFFAEPAQLSAAELAAMFHIYFLGSSEGLIFDVADDNFDTCLWEPLREYLLSRGVRFRTGTTVDAIETDAAQPFRVYAGGEHVDADGVVLAADVAGLQRIAASSPDLGDAGWRSRVGEMRTAQPFVVQRLWLDRPVAADRPPFLGTGGLEPLDNVSVLERYEHQAAEWARRTGGSVVELHSYAVPRGRAGDGLRGRLLDRLHALYPETARANIVDERILTRNDCPQFAPGDHARRPGIATPHPALALAGDGIRIDLPVALMERAATTGWSASNRLLAHWGLAGHPLHTVPVQGRSATLRRLAGGERQPQR
jgi:isorenieratene synthase